MLPAIDYLRTDSQYYNLIVDEETTKQVVFNAMYPPGQSQGLDGLAYCMYQFTLPDHNAAPKIRWHWTGAKPSAGELWLGLPNRARNAWEWHAAENGLHEVSDWTSYLDGDQLLVALAVMAQGEYRLDWIKVGGPVVQTQVLHEPRFGVDWTSAAIVNERPAIAYIETIYYTLYYIRANDSYGFSWTAPVPVTGFADACCSLAVVGGRPAIAYNNSLKLAYRRAADAYGNAWSDAVEVTAQNGSGNYGSLAIVAGKPAASSHSTLGYDLLYTSATDAAGNAWASTVTPDSENSAGAYSSLAVVDGKPAIAYIAGNSVMFVRATDTTGANWGEPVTAAGGFFLSGTCLAVVNGFPAISYISSSKVCYTIAKDTQGTAWGPHTEFEENGSPQNKTSLAVIGGLPAIAYGTLAPKGLYFVKANDALGSTWSAVQPVDQDGDVGEYPTLFEVSGQAGIAYGEDTSSGRKALKYAVLFE